MFCIQGKVTRRNEWKLQSLLLAISSRCILVLHSKEAFHLHHQAWFIHLLFENQYIIHQVLLFLHHQMFLFPPFQTFLLLRNQVVYLFSTSRICCSENGSNYGAEKPASSTNGTDETEIEPDNGDSTTILV